MTSAAQLPSSELSDQNILDMLREDAERQRSPEEILEQKVSYVMGTISKNNDLSKDEVRDIIRNMES